MAAPSDSSLIPEAGPAPGITRLFLVRHGEVEGAYPKRYNGHRDVDLSPTGLIQMEEVARRLAPRTLAGIYCSDLKRAYKGAEILAKGRGLTLQPRGSLREKSFGAWEGLTYEEASGRSPDEWRAWIEDPAGSRPPGGETFKEVEYRVMKEVTAILQAHGGQEVAILAHGGVNRVILCNALHLDLKQVFRIEQRFAALNIIEYVSLADAKVYLMNG